MEKRDAKAEFLTAFWKLYEKKELEKISIRELCQTAGYNRTTFYVYYDDIYDLLDKAIESIFLPIREEIIRRIDFSRALRGSVFAESFLQALHKEDTHIELLFKRHHYLLLGEKIKGEWMTLLREKYSGRGLDFPFLEYVMEYQLSAVMGVIKYWLETGKKLPQQELVRRIYRISENGVFSIVREELGGKSDVEHNQSEASGN